MPTTAPKSIQGMVAVSDTKIKPLGYLTWFSVPDEAIGLRKLKASLASNGLPITLAPKDTKAIDTFKRSVRAVEGRKKNGAITDTEVAPVEETSDLCIYQITRLVRNLDEKVIDFPKAMRVIFDKRTEQIDFNPLGDVSRSEVFTMMEEIQDFYDKNASRVTGARVRAVVRNYLKNEPDEQRGIDGLSGENMRGKAGGIYFVPAVHQEQVEALSAMLQEAYHGRAYLHAVPLADGKSEREMVRAHHVANTREEMMEAIRETKRLLDPNRDRAPRSDVVAMHWAHFHALKRRAARYTQLLSDEAEEITDMSQIMQAQLNKLVGG
jgi:hypothetical protein